MKSIPEMIRDAIAHLTRQTKFYGFYPYKVVDDSTQRPSLQAVGVTNGIPSEILPDQLYLNKAHGVPGVRSTLQNDTIVLVGFVGGDPAQPFVAHYPPGQLIPEQIQFLVHTQIKLADGTNPAAYGDVADQNFETLRTALNVLLTAASQPTIPTLPTTKAQKVRIG